ncbi:RagB/SusD family nutrient uptake outer membrane protein [Flavobacterium soli]|uniref:RagB/SusD family nutrient uptake outer membrane protein n=1 Tax=Flavobacterium soli TaxID=344881 RepID=UPI00040F9CB7|nr:RagB/SusD family nutrient uptake outer membrane protein [Flavobacterium soli]
MKKLSLIKKGIQYTCVLVSALVVTTSCSDDYLDEPKDESGLSADVVFSSRTLADSYVSGIMKRYRGQYTATDAGGLYSLFFARTIKGNDLIQSDNWYGFDYVHENREPNYRRTVFNWTFNYEIIFHANQLISGVERSSNLSETDRKELIATGKAIRAYHYFQLALDFAPNFTSDPNAAKLPIYTGPVTGTSDPAVPSTTAEVYELIKTDLQEAIADLPEERLGKSYINKAVANGMLAQVLLVTQDDWAGAAAAAAAAYGGNAASAVISTNWAGGFNDMTDQDWLWAMYQDAVETTYYFAAPHSMTDHLTLSYQATYVNSVFVDQFADTDVRKKFFDIYGVATPWRKYVTTKFAFTFESDLPIMRKSEMVLIDAEAQLNLGNTQGAKDLLFALQSDRDPNAEMSTNTGAALYDEILLERRKELYGEVGVEFMDAKRLKKSIVRNNVHRVVVNVPVDSPLFFLKVPQREIDANPFIDESINN